MHIEEIDYYLPPELIAQKPIAKRDQSRLMCINRLTGEIIHNQFTDIINYLKPGDLIVVNDTKVLKARFFGKRKTGANIEIFLIETQGIRQKAKGTRENSELVEQEKNPGVKEAKPLNYTQLWTCLIYPTKRVKEGEIIDINEHGKIKIIQKFVKENTHLIEFITDLPIWEFIDKYGNIPLPPYIKLADHNYNDFSERYQTVYANQLGSVAAPTAGLHFTKSLQKKIIDNQIEFASITLHVGLGTFLPIKTAKITDHQMHSEWYNVSSVSAENLNRARKGGRRIIAVGTTVARVLATVYQNHSYQAGSGYTDIFIYPGYNFNAIQGLITNFHLPKSTLILLVMAFAGKELIKKAYEEAIEMQYRFYSFGDAQFIF